MNEMQTLPIRAMPYRHQTEAYAFALKHLMDGGGAALLMEMGTGKTLTSIAIIGALRILSGIRRVLIVAPVSILGVWRDEFERFAGYEYDLTVLEGPVAKKAETLRQMKGTKLQVIVINYESAWRMETALMNWRPDAIICDEGHRIKTHNISASKAMHRLGAQADFRLLLTGTVIVNKPIDVFSQYKFCDPRVFGNSFYQFRNRYFDMCGYGNHTPVMKKNMEPEFAQKLRSIAYRITKDQCLDLPETTDVIQRVDLEPDAMRRYRQLVEESYTVIRQDTVTATNVLTRLLRLTQLTGGFLSGDEKPAAEMVSCAKMNALSELIDSAAESNQKLAVIARFVPEIQAITRMLEKKGMRYAQISGEIKNRDEQVNAFQNDPECRVFVGQIATAGLGITLTAASTMIFYSLDFSMANFDQCKARIHRVGQRNACTYVYLVARGTVDEKILKALCDKSNLAKELVDGFRNGENPFRDLGERSFASLRMTQGTQEDTGVRD